MIDFYRKCFLTQLGKDAGNQEMPDYSKNIIGNYDKYLSKAIAPGMFPGAIAAKNIQNTVFSFIFCTVSSRCRQEPRSI